MVKKGVDVFVVNIIYAGFQFSHILPSAIKLNVYIALLVLYGIVFETSLLVLVLVC